MTGPTEPVSDVSMLASLDLDELRDVWRKTYGPPPKLRSVELLRLMLAWRLQADRLGGLDQDTRRKLARRGPVQPEGLDLGVGTVLSRKWQGRRVEVIVEREGFRHEGQLYPSLSAAATAIAGTRWNGPRFFGLLAKGSAHDDKARGSAAPSTPARVLRTGSNRNSTRSTRSGRPAPPLSPARSTRVGYCLMTRYDDGGLSGGSLERPALQRLLDDMSRTGRIDQIVVYKIDRLTRSLADFAKIVDILDKAEASFVSVTQSFNTATSMGRLTLNMLLSFAQFEREVTAERIRDKIAASKKKGLWMGGNLPLGYDPPRDGTRMLAVNEDEARIVRSIFRRYLDLGSVHDLAHVLEAEGVRSKARQGKDGIAAGGKPFSRGALFYLLRNPVYLGLIRHKGVLHEGLHSAIVDRSLFDAVQEKLTASTRREGSRKGGPRSRSLLTGRIFDATGERMSPTFAIGARGRRYRYYVSGSLQQGRKSGGRGDSVLRRVPADYLEQVLVDRLQHLDGIDAEAPLDALKRVEVHADHVAIIVPAKLARSVRDTASAKEDIAHDTWDPYCLRLTLPIAFPRRGGATSIQRGPADGPRPDKKLIRALRAAHAMLDRDPSGRMVMNEAPTSPHQRQLVRLAFLAPDLQAAILSGRQPEGLTLSRLLAPGFPIDWDAQRTHFGRPRPDS
jgi:site-specific DNA recombinase